MAYVLPKELKSKVKQEELYQLTNVFKNFDRTSNGTIAMADVHMCLHSLGERTKAKQEKELFASHAVDGAVSFKAFVEVLVEFRASGPKAEAKPALTHGCVPCGSPLHSVAHPHPARAKWHARVAPNPSPRALPCVHACVALRHAVVVLVVDQRLHFLCLSFCVVVSISCAQCRSVSAEVTAETATFAKHINSVLGADKDLKGILPINPASSDLYAANVDGLLMAKMINAAVEGTIDERALNKPKKGKDLNV
jgi:hypothetical protein